MALTIFYSWQTDTPSTTNRNFIEDVLKRALKKIKADAELVNSERDGDLTLDKDTKGLPGTPPIVQAIFDKIDCCAVFVPDLTFVGQTLKGRPNPNSNVLIEYGWALKSLGHSRIVPLMNAAFGKPSEQSLPFNMRHLRWPMTYSLAEGAETADRSQVRKKLVDDLADAIRAVLENAPAETGSPVPEFEETKSTYDKAVFFEAGETLASQERIRFSPQDLSVLEQTAKMFLRVIPTAPMEAFTSKQVNDFAKGQLKLPPLSRILMYGGEWYDRNRHGAISFREKDDTIEQLTQILKNRELWGISTEPETWLYEAEGFKILPNGYEAGFIRALENYLEFARSNLDLRLPLRLIAGFTGIEGFKMAAPSGFNFGGIEKFGGKVVEPDIIFEGTVDDWETPAQDILILFFEQVWNSFGFDKRPDAPN